EPNHFAEHELRSSPTFIVNRLPLSLRSPNDWAGGHMLRSILIGLSESKSLRSFAENSALGMHFSKRFVAGTHLHDVIRETEVVNGWGAGVSIDNLGENVTNADEAQHSAELYHRMLDQIHERKLNANISLKLTHMGLDVSEELAFRLVTELVD